MTMKKPTLVIILLFDVVVVSFAIWYMFLRPTDTEGQNYYIRVYVEHSDGSEKGFSFSTNESTLDSALSKAKEPIVELDPSGEETTILSADGEAAPDGMCWRVEIDGELVAADLTQISVSNREDYHLVLSELCN